jgi:hypothetical protein
LPENWRASLSFGGSPGTDEEDISLADWKAANFTPAELLDDAIAGDLADFEQDGMSTVLEYALVADPKVADPQHLPELVTVVDGGSEYLALRFRRRAGAPDLRYEIQSSSALVNWAAATGVVRVASVDVGDGAVAETWRLPAARGAAAEVFLRLRVVVE